MGECHTIIRVYTKYRHLRYYSSHPMKCDSKSEICFWMLRQKNMKTRDFPMTTWRTIEPN